MKIFSRTKKTAGEIARAREDRAFFASVMLLFVIDLASSVVAKFSFRAKKG